ncbi:NB-ARC domains-containing protein, partial [Tanacetum coccineum]
DCTCLKSFPYKLEMDSLQILILTGRLRMEKLPEDLGRMKSLTELHIDRTSIKELRLFGQQESIRSRCYCNLEQVPESIGGLSCLNRLNLDENNFTSLPGSLTQLSHLRYLDVNGCKKLEALPELPPRLIRVTARDCTSLCSITGSSKDQIMMNTSSDLSNCPKLFTNLAIDSQLLLALILNE